MKTSPEIFRLYAVSDRSWLKAGETLVGVTELLLQNGVTCLQLREKYLSDKDFYEEAREMKVLCERYQIPLIINDRVDIAKAIGADGVHVGLSDMGIRKARGYLGDDFIIGGSAHNVAEALAAEAAGADYIGCGAVFGSSTKSDASILPLDELRKICVSVKIPVVAIGGITTGNLPFLAGSGIAGPAVVSALYGVLDSAQAARQLRELWEKLQS